VPYVEQPVKLFDALAAFLDRTESPTSR
jgi:hypothetical protein